MGLFTAEDSRYKISKEGAQETVNKIFEYYEMDISEIDDKEAKKFIQSNYDRLVKAARMGRLEVDLTDGIVITQHLKSGSESLTYREVDGTSKKAMASKDPNDFYGRIYAVQGSLSGIGEAGISKLKGVDLGLCEVLGAIFLQP